jgi:hypothetical protein
MKLAIVFILILVVTVDCLPAPIYPRTENSKKCGKTLRVISQITEPETSSISSFSGNTRNARNNLGDFLAGYNACADIKDFEIITDIVIS